MTLQHEPEPNLANCSIIGHRVNATDVAKIKDCVYRMHVLCDGRFDLESDSLALRSVGIIQGMVALVAKSFCLAAVKEAFSF